MSEQALEVILGLIFIVLGILLLWRHRAFTKSSYYRYLFIAIAILFLGFGAYLAAESLMVAYENK